MAVAHAITRVRVSESPVKRGSDETLGQVVSLDAHRKAKGALDCSVHLSVVGGSLLSFRLDGAAGSEARSLAASALIAAGMSLLGAAGCEV